MSVLHEGRLQQVLELACAAQQTWTSVRQRLLRLRALADGRVVFAPSDLSTGSAVARRNAGKIVGHAVQLAGTQRTWNALVGHISRDDEGEPVPIALRQVHVPVLLKEGGPLEDCLVNTSTEDAMYVFIHLAGTPAEVAKRDILTSEQVDALIVEVDLRDERDAYERIWCGNDVHAGSTAVVLAVTGLDVYMSGKLGVFDFGMLVVWLDEPGAAEALVEAVEAASRVTACQRRAFAPIVPAETTA